MKHIVTITGIFVILGFAFVGCLYIFDVVSFSDSKSLLLKAEAAIILLGGTVALIAVLMGTNKALPD